MTNSMRPLALLLFALPLWPQATFRALNGIAPSGGPPPSFTAVSASDNSGCTSCVIPHTGSYNLAAGHYLAVFITGVATGFSVSDSAGNTWTCQNKTPYN